jgi:hypothetical protein
MAGSPRKRERRERVEALMTAEDSLDWLCARIASGETLVEFCREQDIPYVGINEWIQADDDRREQYRQALLVRESHSKELVIGELRNLLTADISEAFYADGSVKPMAEIPENVRRCLAGLELSEIWGGVGEDRMQVGVLKKIRCWDKMKAIELLAKTLNMLSEKREITGEGGGPVKVLAIRYPEKAATVEEWTARHKPKQVTDGDAE